MSDIERAIATSEEQLDYLIHQLGEAERTNVIDVVEDILKLGKVIEFLKGRKDA